MLNGSSHEFLINLKKSGHFVLSWGGSLFHGLNKYQPEAICQIQALLIVLTPTLTATKTIFFYDLIMYPIIINDLLGVAFTMCM